MHDDLNRAFGLMGRVAVITGAASGIGRETAVVLAQAGATPVLADINEAGLAETASLVEAAGGRALSVRTDVSRRADIDALADEAIQREGRLDIWVNAAGILAHIPILDVTEEDLERLLTINQKGVFWGCAAAGRVMKDVGSGSIINLSSNGGEMPAPGLALYGMTKAAVAQLTRTVATEFGPFGVRANTVSPGWVETPMVGFRFKDEKGEYDPDRRDAAVKMMAGASPLGLTGKASDIAFAILYLASDASRFVTGQTIRPNGGVSMP